MPEIGIGIEVGIPIAIPISMGVNCHRCVGLRRVPAANPIYPVCSDRCQQPLALSGAGRDERSGCGSDPGPYP